MPILADISSAKILFVAGLSFVIGLERTFRFFFQRHKAKATSFFLGGIFVVLTGWPIIGVVLEIYGFFLLFRGFFPVAVGFIRRVPVLGSLLSLPGLRTLVDKIGESNSMASKMSLKVPLLVVLLVSQCWSAPYRRNWTPQAILYLKGALNFNQIDDGLGLSSASVELLQQAAEE
ncbi:hypothetical protein CCH79_00016311, partial [Gambusia affinis]